MELIFLIIAILLGLPILALLAKLILGLVGITLGLIGLPFLIVGLVIFLPILLLVGAVGLLFKLFLPLVVLGVVGFFAYRFLKIRSII